MAIVASNEVGDLYPNAEYSGYPDIEAKTVGNELLALGYGMVIELANTLVQQNREWTPNTA